MSVIDFLPKGKKVMAVGPHPDDVELGCFGTLARLSGNNPLEIIVLSAGENNGDKETRVSELKKASGLIGARSHCLYIPDGHIRDDYDTIKAIEKRINDFKPDLIFNIYANDTHQDHRYTSLAVNSAARNIPNLLYYASISTTAFVPNVFVDITDEIDKKIECVECYTSQFAKGALDQVLRGVAGNYGVVLRHSDRLFEGFAVGRLIL